MSDTIQETLICNGEILNVTFFIENTEDTDYSNLKGEFELTEGISIAGSYTTIGYFNDVDDTWRINYLPGKTFGTLKLELLVEDDCKAPYSATLNIKDKTKKFKIKVCKKITGLTCCEVLACAKKGTLNCAGLGGN